MWMGAAGWPRNEVSQPPVRRQDDQSLDVVELLRPVGGAQFLGEGLELRRIERVGVARGELEPGGVAGADPSGRGLGVHNLGHEVAETVLSLLRSPMTATRRGCVLAVHPARGRQREQVTDLLRQFDGQRADDRDCFAAAAALHGCSPPVSG